MRRIVILPLLLTAGLLAGCSQITQIGGEAIGIPVGEVCTAVDDAYAQYESLLEQGEATEEQLSAARDELVADLESVAEDVDGQVGDLIRSGAETLGDITDLQSPESIEAITQLKESISTFCG